MIHNFKVNLAATYYRSELIIELAILNLPKPRATLMFGVVALVASFSSLTVAVTILLTTGTSGAKAISHVRPVLELDVLDVFFGMLDVGRIVTEFPEGPIV